MALARPPRVEKRGDLRFQAQVKTVKLGVEASHCMAEAPGCKQLRSS